ncbi:Uncharacterized protein Fot_20157 [Forsythia ovata]|uniref:Reverse transcriptase zinc-binding domain-containing protein n=1 Tax=Forsythia ovata TaxID=205694 RepID=A0ABD1VN43_9LAMI
MGDSDRCGFCGRVESTAHALFQCPWAKAMWKEAGLWFIIKIYFSCPDFRDVLIWVTQNLMAQALVGFIFCLLWTIWGKHNEAILGDIVVLNRKQAVVLVIISQKWE